jgi:hypothetical protein
LKEHTQKLKKEAMGYAQHSVTSFSFVASSKKDKTSPSPLSLGGKNEVLVVVEWSKEEEESGEGEEEEERGDSFCLNEDSSSLTLWAVGGKRREEGSWDARIWRKR